MVSDTKKRGRPRKFEAPLYDIFDSVEPRAAQNRYYAALTMFEILKERPGGFFVSARGNLRRQGIAEQIGRMYEAGLITADQGRELTQETIKDYNGGATVKEIVRNLSVLRQALAGADNPKTTNTE